MPAVANRQRAVYVAAALAGVLVAAGVVITAFRAGPAAVTKGSGTTLRPPADTPRGVLWDLWHAAMRDDRDAVRAAFHATTDAERRAADALADLLVAESRFARQLRRTWPVSPTSRDGAGTWFGEGGDAATFAARETIDPAAIDATVTVQGTPVKLIRAGGPWKIDVTSLAHTKLNGGSGASGRPGAGGAKVDLAAAAERLETVARVYRDLRAEVGALRIASPSVAVQKLHREISSVAAATQRS